MEDRPSSEEVIDLRLRRYNERRNRKIRGRARAMYGIVYPERDWLKLTAEDREVWCRAVGRAEIFDHDDNPLAMAAALGKYLEFYDSFEPRLRYFLPERAFLQLPTEDQRRLYRLALHLHEPLIIEAKPEAVLSTELFGKLSAEQADELFEHLQESLGSYLESHPERTYDAILSITTYSSSRKRWETSAHR